MNNKRAEFKELLDKTIVKNYDSVNSYENQIQNLRSFVHNIIPEKLYRYRKYNQDTIKDLKTFIIRPSSPQFFNDPYDCQIFIDKNEIFEKIQNANFKYYISKWLELNPNFENLLSLAQKKSLSEAFDQSNQNLAITFKLFLPMFNKMVDEAIYQSLALIKQITKICCFSEDVKSPLMWAHYTDSHKGFAVEYDFRNYSTPCVSCQNKCSQEHYESLFPIVYSIEKFNAKDFLSEYMLQIFMSNFSKNLFIPKDDILAIYKIFLHKSLDWEYEKEWRFISMCQNHPGIKVKPSAIYLGCKMEQSNRNELCSFARENNIPIYQMYINFSQKEYSFDYKKI